MLEYLLHRHQNTSGSPSFMSLRRYVTLSVSKSYSIDEILAAVVVCVQDYDDCDAFLSVFLQIVDLVGCKLKLHYNYYDIM